MSPERQKSPVLGRVEGGKTLVSVTDLVHRIAALEKQVARIPELEARVAALEKGQGQTPRSQDAQAVAGVSVSGIQNVGSLGARGASTTAMPYAPQSPAPQANMGIPNTALNRYSSEMNLVEAIKDIQRLTGQTHPVRSIVAQHMIDDGTADKVFKFKTICIRAEKAGLVELGSDNGYEWITTKAR